MKWKKRCRGAISIFLVIIFLASYMLVGVLVDGGRYKMAQAMAESALDSASSSVLSYYNQLVYDLYGLLATDSLSQSTINALMDDYVGKTLGVIEIDDKSAAAIRHTIFSTITGGSTEPVKPFDGYKFQLKPITGSIDASLANTDFVEYQIIEHMKYRAPMKMSGADEFLGKLNEILTLGKSLAAVQEKLEISAKQEENNLFTDANALMQEMNTFHTEMQDFCDNYAGTGANSMTPADRAKDFDQKMEKISAEFLSDWPTYTPPKTDSTGRVNADKDSGKQAYEIKLNGHISAYKERCQVAKADITEKFSVMNSSAAALKELADGLATRRDTIEKGYVSYIKELKKNLEGHQEDQVYETMYAGEIKMAEDGLKKIGENAALLGTCQQLTGDIIQTYLSSKGVLDAAIDGILSDYEAYTVGNRDGSPGNVTPETLERTFTNGMCTEMNSKWTAALSTMSQKVGTYQQYEPPKITKEPDLDQNAAQSLSDESAPDQKGLRGFEEPKDLEVPYEQPAPPATPATFDGNAAQDATDAVSGGVNLLAFLGGVLENARDGLYIGEYAMSQFPNVVKNGNEPQGQAGTAEHYWASQAELEYIFVGNSKAQVNIAAVNASLLGVRMAFNTAAIFTDGARVQQAGQIATAAGPFAPLVAIALLAAWALAESVVDVVMLAWDKEVALFKRGKDWTLSVTGIIKATSGFVGDELANMVTESAETGGIQIGEGMTDDAADSIGDAIADAATKAVKSKPTPKSTTDTPQDEPPKPSAEINLNKDETPKPSAEINLNKDETPKPSSEINMDKDPTPKPSIDLDKGENPKPKPSEKPDTGGDGTEHPKPSSTPTGDGGDTAQDDETKKPSKLIMMDYLDYMRIFLLLTPNRTKVQRIQSLVQANLRYGGQAGFTMADSYGAVRTQLEGSIPFLMMGEAIIPASLRQSGRLTFTVSSAMSY